ncbi:MAG: Peptidoglycan/xylan/chitin deacetylase, PgdA/CDA1 family [Lachnoclostridium sp.]
MDRDKRTSGQITDNTRRKRVKRIKTGIIVIALVLLILPIILCIIIFFKLSYLQKQIDILMIDRYGTTYTSQSNRNNEHVAHAATVYKSSLTPSIKKNDTKTDESAKDTNKPSSNVTEDINSNDKTDAKNITDANEETDRKENNTSAAIVKNTTGDNNKLSGDLSQNSIVKISKKSSNKTKKDQSTSVNDTDKVSEEIKEFDDKQVYLTFDDGPSKYTEEILQVLSDYGVKATFFVIGHTDEHSKKMYNEIIDQGHTLGMHSYSHNYKKIYKSVEDFDKDFTKIRKLLYDTTGYLPTIYRFPGGSSSINRNEVYKYIEYLNRKSVVYFDWNVISGDAIGVDYTAKELYENVIDGVKLHNRSIVLMHDTDAKVNTIESLKMILKTLKKYGAEILPLDDTVTPIQQVKASKTKAK